MVALFTDPASALHLALLLGFTGGASLLMLLTVANRLRLRRVVRVWSAGRLGGLPVAPVLFLACVGSMIAYAYAVGQTGHLHLLLGYLVGGTCWLVAAFYAASIVVTDFGIVTHINRTGHAVAWGQVVDYFHVDEGRHQRYVFFYTDATSARRRLTLEVPAKYGAAFDLVVRTKLDARFEFYAEKAYGTKALEG